MNKNLDRAHGPFANEEPSDTSDLVSAVSWEARLAKARELRERNLARDADGKDANDLGETSNPVDGDKIQQVSGPRLHLAENKTDKRANRLRAVEPTGNLNDRMIEAARQRQQVLAAKGHVSRTVDRGEGRPSADSYKKIILHALSDPRNNRPEFPSLEGPVSSEAAATVAAAERAPKRRIFAIVAALLVGLAGGLMLREPVLRLFGGSPQTARSDLATAAEITSSADVPAPEEVANAQPVPAEQSVDIPDTAPLERSLIVALTNVSGLKPNSGQSETVGAVPLVPFEPIDGSVTRRAGLGSGTQINPPVPDRLPLSATETFPFSKIVPKTEVSQASSDLGPATNIVVASVLGSRLQTQQILSNGSPAVPVPKFTPESAIPSRATAGLSTLTNAPFADEYPRPLNPGSAPPSTGSENLGAIRPQVSVELVTGLALPDSQPLAFNSPVTPFEILPANFRPPQAPKYESANARPAAQMAVPDRIALVSVAPDWYNFSSTGADADAPFVANLSATRPFVDEPVITAALASVQPDNPIRIDQSPPEAFAEPLHNTVGSGANARPYSDFRVSLNAPTSLGTRKLSVIETALSETGFPVAPTNRVGFTITKSNVRYFHPQDAEIAEMMASVVGGIARNFTNFSPSPKVGTIEIWLAGNPPKPKPRRSNTSARAEDPALSALKAKLLQSLRRGDHLP